MNTRVALKRGLRRLGVLESFHAVRYRLADPRWWRRLCQEADFYRRFIRPGDRVLDIGVNCGFKTQVFRRLGARVIAAEPLPQMVERLRERFGDDPAVTIVPAAVSDHVGQAELRVGSNLLMSSLESDWSEGAVVPGVAAAGRTAVSVAATTLDALIAAHGKPAFIKVDVEGHEPAVFTGLSRPVPALSFEFKPDLPDRSTACVRRLIQLDDYRFNYDCGQHNGPALASPHWLSAGDLTALLEQPGGPTGQNHGGDIYARLRNAS